MTPGTRRWLLSGLVVVAGCCAGLGFEPLNLWFLVPFAVATFVCVNLVSTPKVGLLRGYLFGVGFNIVAFHWVDVLGVAVLVVFVMWLAVWYAVVGLVISLTRKTPSWGFAGVAAWMGAEWASARWPFGGFGWGRLAFTAAGTPIDGLFPIISVTGVSCVIVSTGFLVAWLVRRGWAAWQSRDVGRGRTLSHLVSSRTVVVPAAWTLSILLVSGVGGLVARWYDPPPDTRNVTATVIQGNVPGSGITALGPIYTVENNHLAETIILAAKIRTGEVKQPDFVVWPENSTATDPYADQRTQTIINRAIDVARAPIFVGAIISGPGKDERQTVGLWWTANGVTDSYAKRNLVPFGEWVPFRSVMMKLVPELTYVGAQSVPGTTPGVLNVEAGGSPLRVGDLICFEVAYDSTVNDMLIGGAQVVVVQTSNAMFTGTDQMVQQDAITRIRAMEARREILVATTNSLAGLIDSHGRIVYEAQLRTSDAQVFTVPTRTALTPAVRYQKLIDILSVMIPLLGAASVYIQHRRVNQPRDPDIVR